MSYNGGGGGFRGHGGRGGGADPVHVKPWRPAPSSSAENANFLTDCYYYLNDMCTKVSKGSWLIKFVPDILVGAQFFADLIIYLLLPLHSPSPSAGPRLLVPSQ